MFCHGIANKLVQGVPKGPGGCYIPRSVIDAGWSSPVARQAHNLKVVSSNLAPATKKARYLNEIAGFPDSGISTVYNPSYDTIIVAAFSAIITTGDAVFPETIFGMIEASTTRNPLIP
jgi:hypothetical protein